MVESQSFSGSVSLTYDFYRCSKVTFFLSVGETEGLEGPGVE